MSDHNTNEKSFFNDLWDRRFFQFLATYIAASWGAIQFLEWVVRRYDQPSIWVDKLVVLLLCLLPFILSLIYFHGRSGDDKWHKFEKVAYPINIVFALIMSTFIINASAVDMTTEVTITNEEGEEEVRQVTKIEYIQKLVIFPVESQASDDIDWEDIGLGMLIDLDIEQDMSVSGVSPIGMKSSYDDYGFTKLQKVPFATKLNIAEDLYSNYFLTIDQVDNEAYHVRAQIFKTSTGKSIADKEIKEEDIFKLTDALTVFASSAIKATPTENGDEYVDLPADNLITRDTTALRNYVQSLIVYYTSASQTEKMAELLEKSVTADPSCSECWAQSAYIDLLNGKDDDSKIDNAFKYIDNLPERQQLNIKYLNYLIDNDITKSIKLCEMWSKLYPQDVKPYNNRVTLYKQTFQIDEAKSVVKEAIDNGHKGAMYLSYAKLLIETKDWKGAEVYLKKYKEAYPKQYEAASLLVDVYKGKGQIEKAVEEVDNLMLMRPNDNDLVLKKADLLAKQNDFESAIKTMNISLSKLTSPSDTVKNYVEQLQILNRAMRYEEYADLRRELKSTFLRNFPALAFVQMEYQTVGFYRDIGLIDSIVYHLDMMTSKLPEAQKSRIARMNMYMIDLMTENESRIDESYAEVKPMFDAIGNEMFTILNEGEIAYIKSDYETAITNFSKAKDLLNGNYDLLSLSFYKSLYESEKYEEGLTILDEILLLDPLHPIYNLFKTQFQLKLVTKNLLRNE